LNEPEDLAEAHAVAPEEPFDLPLAVALDLRAESLPRLLPGSPFSPGERHLVRAAASLLHRVVTAEQARIIREAIRNHRAILKLLRAWERETIRVIELLGRHKR
jgi:hypothetical protein